MNDATKAVIEFMNTFDKCKLCGYTPEYIEIETFNAYPSFLNGSVSLPQKVSLVIESSQHIYDNADWVFLSAYRGVKQKPEKPKDNKCICSILQLTMTGCICGGI